MSTSDAYRAYDVIDYFRGSTSIHSRRADEQEAELLQQHVDQPVLVVRKVDVDGSGAPIAYGEGIWAGSRVQFVFDGGDEGAEKPTSASIDPSPLIALKLENDRLRRAVSDLILEKLVLQDAAAKSPRE